MTSSPLVRDTAVVEPWPSESPRFVLALIVSLLLWFIALVSIVGIVYAAAFGLFFFILHLGFIAHVRGNGVRLGTDQFPELHSDVERMARRLGLTPVPEAYVIQAGGTLNAFATRFLGADIVVLYSDLLDACGDNRAARDMIIAHELGHVKAGHLRWHWVLLPSQLVPLLGSALSRAREYTCDRYGLAGAGELDGALTGLTILAAGATHGPKVNRQALVRQRTALAGAWMTLGQWFSTHPPLAKRLLALDPRLGAGEQPSSMGKLAAAAILVLFFGGGGAATVAAVTALPKFAETVEAARLAAVAVPAGTPTGAMAEIQRLVDYIEGERGAERPLPADDDALYDAWNAAHPGATEPGDPYDGLRLGYVLRDTEYIVWSSGPDGESGTEDDLRRTVRLQ